MISVFGSFKTSPQLFGDLDYDPQYIGFLEKFKSTYFTKSKKTIHIIPHSHDDLGWLRTIELYYKGGENNFYLGSVESILSTTV